MAVHGGPASTPRSRARGQAGRVHTRGAALALTVVPGVARALSGLRPGHALVLAYVRAALARSPHAFGKAWVCLVFFDEGIDQLAVSLGQVRRVHRRLVRLDRRVYADCDVLAHAL